MSTMDKVTERIFNIAENKKEMPEEQPKPSLNLPWRCHTSTAWLHSSKRKLTYSRTLQCDGGRIRTRSRKAPKVRQLQHPQVPRNSEPQWRLPPLLPQRTLPCPPLMAVRLWTWIPTAVRRNHLVPLSLIPSRTLRHLVAPLPPPRNQSRPQWLLHLLDQKTNRKIKPPSLHRRESSLVPPQSHALFVMKSSQSFLPFPKSGLWSRLT